MPWETKHFYFVGILTTSVVAYPTCTDWHFLKKNISFTQNFTDVHHTKFCKIMHTSIQTYNLAVSYFEQEIIVYLLKIPEEYLPYFVHKYNQISKSNLDKIIYFFMM